MHVDQRRQRLVGLAQRGRALAHPLAALAHLRNPAFHPGQVVGGLETALAQAPHHRRAPDARAVVVPDRGQFGQQLAQALRRAVRIVRRGDGVGVGAVRVVRLRGRRARGRDGPRGLFMHGLGLEQHVRGHEATRLGDVAQQLLARLDLARFQELGQHDENGRRAGVAAPRQIAEPALARNSQTGLVQQVGHHRNEFLGRVMAQEMVNLVRSTQPSRTSLAYSWMPMSNRCGSSRISWRSDSAPSASASVQDG